MNQADGTAWPYESVLTRELWACVEWPSLPGTPRQLRAGPWRPRPVPTGRLSGEAARSEETRDPWVRGEAPEDSQDHHPGNCRRFLSQGPHLPHRPHGVPGAAGTPAPAINVPGAGPAPNTQVPQTHPVLRSPGTPAPSRPPTLTPPRTEGGQRFCCRNMQKQTREEWPPAPGGRQTRPHQCADTGRTTGRPTATQSNTGFPPTQRTGTRCSAIERQLVNAISSQIRNKIIL